MKRKVININEEKCDGCGLCVPNCNEGAIQIIDGKAQLISDLFCDGLGACIGKCPKNAITIEEREAQPYNEIKVMENLIAKNDNIIIAHLKHLYEHNEIEYLEQALNYLKDNNKIINLNFMEKKAEKNGGCLSSKMIELNVINHNNINNNRNNSMLAQWPIQLHLVNPNAPYFKNKELVILSTCSPVASANIHSDYLQNRAVVIACPKLDDTSPYIDKLISIFKLNNIPKAIIVRMEVPCCGGLTQMAYISAIHSNIGVELVEDIISLNGELLYTKEILQRGEYVS